ncbi:MAG: hybrid sensor histidine kinase/response regulator [Myxococcales bacterium]|nr:MAG: hybrid sensor histidine kinase/response regulator [Myxococcales bacterium]
MGVPAPELDPRVDILLVDDNPRNLLALEAMLSDPGLNLVRAHSGAEALRRLLEQDFALALLDIQMPELDGLQTAELIRSRERSRHMPIIFLTAFSGSDEQVARAYNLGAVDFLLKPIVPLILRSKVQALVELFRKTEQVKRQAQRLREVEQLEHTHRLEEASRRWQEARLREQMKDLAEAARRKDEFLAMLAHELRNPMAPIVNAVQVLRLPDVPAAMTQRALGAIERQVGHMARLVDDLLDVSRINTGKVELRKERVVLQTILDQAVQTSMPLLQKSRHEFVASVPPAPIVLQADGTRLTQVVANLLNNAAKYSKPEGHIELSVATEHPDVVITVRDRGIGIRPEMLEQVFELFVQSDRTPDRSQGGLGIGLTLVKSLVEMHGGHVTAHSEGLERGSEFRVRLPLAPTFSLPPPPLVAPSSGVVGRRIMLVEDNADVRETLQDFLQLSGHEVTFAEDGPSAVDALLRERPDVALVDIGLPVLDGYGVVKAVRELAPDLTTFFIAITGYGRPRDRELALEAGFHEHLVKPVDTARLLQLIDDLHRVSP